MSFGWSAGDVLQTAKIAWDVYKCIADGTQNAKSDFTQFQAEFELMRATIEELQEAEADVPVSKRVALGESYERTIIERTDFVRKHQRLASDIHSGRPKELLHWHKVPDRVKTLFHQVSWPTERKEAERLRRALERNVQLANLMATNTVIDIQKQYRHKDRQENLEILRAIKIMSLQISFILRQCMPWHTSSSGENTLDSRLLSELTGVLKHFPDPNSKNHELHRPIKCTISVYLHHRTRDVGLIEAIDVTGRVKITHRIHEAAFRGAQSSVIPYIESAHVVNDPISPFRICFQGSHRVKMETNGGSERYAISPVYICRTHAGFLEWPLDGFVELKYSKLSTRLQLQGEAITRRNSMGSIGSMMSNGSRHSTMSMSSSGRHIRQLAIVFHDERDCEAFRKILRSQ
ncbi:hypothetical protein KXX39_006921 [Aspergillus fumigatus]|nr:hypothetical protein KXX39_006921 [Aspergillus fumigatus]